MLALFCYILTSGLFQFMGDSITHPILSMLLTHNVLAAFGPTPYPFFSQKGYPSHITFIDKWHPFHIPRLERGIPFNCCKCTVF